MKIALLLLLFAAIAYGAPLMTDKEIGEIVEFIEGIASYDKGKYTFYLLAHLHVNDT
jgi:hypothetical protein